METELKALSIAQLYKLEADIIKRMNGNTSHLDENPLRKSLTDVRRELNDRRDRMGRETGKYNPKIGMFWRIMHFFKLV